MCVCMLCVSEKLPSFILSQDDKEENSDADKDEDSPPASPILVAAQQLHQKADASKSESEF